MRPSAKATVYSHGTATCAEIYLTNEIPDNHHFLESLNQIQELVMNMGTEYLIDDAEDFFGPVTNEAETGPSKRGILSYLPNLGNLTYVGSPTSSLFEKIAEHRKIYRLNIGIPGAFCPRIDHARVVDSIDLCGVEFCDNLEVLHLIARRISGISLLSHLRLTDLAINFAGEGNQVESLAGVNGDFIQYLTIRADILSRPVESFENPLSFQEALHQLLGGSFPKLRKLILMIYQPSGLSEEFLTDSNRELFRHQCQKYQYTKPRYLLHVIHSRQVLACMNIHRPLKALIEHYIHDANIRAQQEPENDREVMGCKVEITGIVESLGYDHYPCSEYLE